MILSHSYALTLANERTEPFNLLSRFQATGGRIAVDLFFILSGFLIAASYERSSSALSYLRKRVARIYPAFILLTLITVAVVLPMAHGRVSGATFSDKTLNVIGNTLILRSIGTDRAFLYNPAKWEVNGSLWSNAFEFWCYIGVMLLGLTGLLRSKKFLVEYLGRDSWPDIRLSAVLGEAAADVPGGRGVLPFRQEIPFSPKLVVAALIAMVVAFRGSAGVCLAFPRRWHVSGEVLQLCSVDPASWGSPLR